MYDQLAFVLNFIIHTQCYVIYICCVDGRMIDKQIFPYSMQMMYRYNSIFHSYCSLLIIIFSSTNNN